MNGIFLNKQSHFIHKTNMKQTLITDYFNGSKRKNSNENKNESDILSNNTNDTNGINNTNKKTRKIIYGYNPETGSWHCIECGVDMGPDNPRQYCRKSYCENSYWSK